MSDRTQRENELAAGLIEGGWPVDEVAAHLGISIGGLYRRGYRDPKFGDVLATVKRPHQVRSPEAEEQLVSMWFQPENYTVTQIAKALGITRQTVHRWAHDLDLPPVRLHCRVRSNRRSEAPPAQLNEEQVIKALSRRLRIDESAAVRLLASVRYPPEPGGDLPQ